MGRRGQIHGDLSSAARALSGQRHRHPARYRRRVRRGRAGRAADPLDLLRGPAGLRSLWTSSVVRLVLGPSGPPPWSHWSSAPWTSAVVPLFLCPSGPPPWSRSVPLDLCRGPAGLRSLWTSTVVPLVCPSADGEATARYFVSIAITAS